MGLRPLFDVIVKSGDVCISVKRFHYWKSIHFEHGRSHSYSNYSGPSDSADPAGSTAIPRLPRKTPLVLETRAVQLEKCWGAHVGHVLDARRRHIVHAGSIA